MKRGVRTLLWVGIASVATIGIHPAQLFSELMRGAILNVPTDMFGCGTVGTTPCGLRYRIYPLNFPAEVNSPANPADGIPRYGTANTRYVTDTVTTANYPLAAAQGAGKEWYTVWDGLTGGGTAAHAGWYGAQSQKVVNFELGNSLSLNCLPVTSQEACFAALNTAGGGNNTTRADGSALNRVGGISPIPCPTVSASNLDGIDLSWEEADNFTIRDGATAPIVGTTLYALMDPTAAPSDADLASSGVVVGSYPRTTTSAVVDRTDPALAGGTVYGFANKVRYAGGKESTAFSCNSALTGVCIEDAVGDAPASVDIQRVCVELRTDGLTGNEYVVITYDIVGSPSGVVAHDRIQHTAFLDSNEDGDPGPEARLDARALNATLSARRGAPVVLRFDANFSAPTLGSLSTTDDAGGRVSWVIDADDLSAGLGGARSFTLDARVKLPSADDQLEGVVFSW